MSLAFVRQPLTPAPAKIASNLRSVDLFPFDLTFDMMADRTDGLTVSIVYLCCSRCFLIPARISASVLPELSFTAHGLPGCNTSQGEMFWAARLPPGS